MTNKQKFDRLRKLLDEADVYARAVGKLDFDMQCCAPKDGMEQAGPIWPFCLTAISGSRTPSATPSL